MRIINKTIYSRLLGCLIKKGKKVYAKKLLDNSLLKVSKKHNFPVYFILSKIFSKLNFYVEVKKVKSRRRVFTIPFPLTSKRHEFLKIKLLINAAKENKQKASFSDKLALEMSNILLDKNSRVLEKKISIRKEAS